ncbi:unnamed protein product [Boreogadus saida]
MEARATEAPEALAEAVPRITGNWWCACGKGRQMPTEVESIEPSQRIPWEQRVAPRSSFQYELGRSHPRVSLVPSVHPDRTSGRWPPLGYKAPRLPPSAQR